MTVYVDNATNEYGRMIMCHMLADTTSELLSMADKIGVARRWLQKAGTYKEHFDICLAKRERALMAGAVEISQTELRGLLRRKRAMSDNTRFIEA
jgi:Protein of unknown function (DUF4031)